MISERLNAYIAEQNLRLLTDPRFKTVKTERGVVQLSVNGWGLQGGRDFQWFPTLEAAVEYYGGEVKT